jgi:hypothetical protein
MEHRALYNLLRMNWLRDPSMKVEPWQVDDYRALPMETLFSRLSAHHISLDRVSFLALAENLDSPEELTEYLIADSDLSNETQDQIFLVVFELWRRLVPEKLCLSIFCDELDFQIDQYDKEGLETNNETLQDVLANFAVILDENTDQGATPQEIFETIGLGCANDVENFLYDFISDQIDNKNESYAAELLDDFMPYVKDTKWFELLKARVVTSNDIAQANLLVAELIQAQLDDPDLEFNLEALASLVKGGDKTLFLAIVTQSIPVLETEGDFQDLLSICSEYLQFMDKDRQEQTVNMIIQQRSKNDPELPFDQNTPHLNDLVNALR